MIDCSKFQKCNFSGLKENSLCCNIFLRNRCICCIRSSHHYKFEESKWKNGTFWYCSFKTNTVECSFLTVPEKAWYIRFNCWSSIFIVKKLARKFRNLAVNKIVFFIDTFQEQMRWSFPIIQNWNFTEP